MPRLSRKKTLALTAIVAQLRKYGKVRSGIASADITRGKVHKRPDLSEHVKREILCGSAWRELRTQRHYPAKKRMAALCQDCLERIPDLEAPQESRYVEV